MYPPPLIYCTVMRAEKQPTFNNSKKTNIKTPHSSSSLVFVCLPYFPPIYICVLGYQTCLLTTEVRGASSTQSNISSVLFVKLRTKFENRALGSPIFCVSGTVAPIWLFDNPNEGPWSSIRIEPIGRILSRKQYLTGFSQPSPGCQKTTNGYNIRPLSRNLCVRISAGVHLYYDFHSGIREKVSTKSSTYS